MEITKKMYELAKEIVEEYEKINEPVYTRSTSIVERSSKHIFPMDKYLDAEEQKVLSNKLRAVFEKNNYNNPFKDGEIMPCCGNRYCFSYDAIKYLPKNPKLKYRKDGDIDNDPYSRKPTFVSYNNCREAIRQAKAAGLTHVHWSTSIAVEEELVKDGYIVHHNCFDIISW